MIMVGASAYPRVIDFARIRGVADRCGARDGHRHGPHRGPRRRRRAPEPGAPLRLRHDDDAQDAARAAGGPGPVQGEVGEGPRPRRVPRRAGRAARAHHRGQGGLLQGGRSSRPSRPTSGRSSRTRRALAAVIAVARLPARLGRHRQPPDAGRRVLEGPHRARTPRPPWARPGITVNQNTIPVRPEPAAQGQRHPHRHAGRHDARHGRGGDGRHRRVHRPGAGVARRRAGARDGARRSGSPVPEVPAVPGQADSRRARRARLRRRRPAGAGRRRSSSPGPGSATWPRPSPGVFGRGGILLAEAGTGTGKTLAYLVPGHPERPPRARVDRHQEPPGADLLQGRAAAARGARRARSPPPT